MEKSIIALTLFMAISAVHADNYSVKYNLEGHGAALSTGSIVLVDKTPPVVPPVEPPVTPPVEPPVTPPTGPVCGYNEDPSNRTMWVNGVNSYYKTFLIYHEGTLVFESSTGSVNVDTPKLIKGVTYSKGIVRFDGGQYPRYELCVETK